MGFAQPPAALHENCCALHVFATGRCEVVEMVSCTGDATAKLVLN